MRIEILLNEPDNDKQNNGMEDDTGLDIESDFHDFKRYVLTEIATILHRNYRDKCEKRCCSASHKQCKTLFRDHMVRLKIISLYI